MLFAGEFKLQGKTFCLLVPALDWKQAQEFISQGFPSGEIKGEDVHEVSAINPRMLMDFLDGCVREPINWSLEAEDQLHAFLSMSWEKKPEVAESEEEPEPPKEVVGKDLLTGRTIYKEDPSNGKCPRCGKLSVISDAPSTERCLSCGWCD